MQKCEIQYYIVTSLIYTRLYVALRHDAALPRARKDAAAAFATWAWPCGFAATHGRGHVRTTINIEMIHALTTSQLQLHKDFSTTAA